MMPSNPQALAPRPTSRRVYPAHAIMAVIRTMAQYGVEQEQILQGSDIDPSTLLQPATRLSTAQILIVLQNTCNLAPDPMIAAYTGHRMNVAACGFYGYALMSSPSHESVVKFVQKYDRMLSPFSHVWFSSNGKWAVWNVDMAADIQVSQPLYGFLMEMKFAAMLTLMRDLYGPGDHIHQVRIKSPAPAHAHRFSALMGCPVIYGSEANDAQFDASMMNRPMAYADALSNAAMVELCDQILFRIQEHGDATEAVQSLLVGKLGEFPSADSIARELGMSGRRALHRRLREEGTTYRELIKKIRMNLAGHYLNATDLTVEDISSRLGYRDTTGFRQAFHRWATVSPSAYRRKNLGFCGTS